MNSKIVGTVAIGTLIVGVSKIAFDFGAKMGMAYLISEVCQDEASQKIMDQIKNDQSKWGKNISNLCAIRDKRRKDNE